MIRTIRRLRDLLRDDTGASAVEYALLASLVAAVIATIVGSLGLTVKGLFASLVF